MQINDVKIRKIIHDGRLKAVVSVTVDYMLAVHDIKIVQGEDRLFVAMPSRRDENGTYRDIVHPISADVREMFEKTILDAYETYISRAPTHHNNTNTNPQALDEDASTQHHDKTYSLCK